MFHVKRFDHRNKLFFIYSHEKSAAETGNLVLVTAQHLAGEKQVNVRRSLNDLR